MQNPIVIRENWFARMLRRIKAITVIERPQTYRAGLLHGSDLSTAPPIDPVQALSAPSQFPYLFASNSIVATDLASLPLIVKRGNPGDPDAERLDNHPFLELIKQPNSSETGRYFREQLWTDYNPNGWAVVLKLYDTRGQVISLVRLHPKYVTVRTDDFGFLSGIKYDPGNAPQHYSTDDVLFFRSPGWAPGPAGEYGCGWVKPLMDDLNSEHAVVQFNKKAFKQGKPEMLATPKDPATPPVVGQGRQDIEDKLNRQVRRAHGGLYYVPQAVELTQWATTPKDMEGIQQRDWNRRSVGSVTGVPPILYGWETANYATAKEQNKVYWMRQLKRWSVFGDQWSMLARQMSGDSRDTVVPDLSAIEALQESRTEQLNRVQIHIQNGMAPSDAYAFEGLEDAPIDDTPAAAPASSGPSDANETENTNGQQERAAGPRIVRRLFEKQRKVHVDDAVWFARIDKVNTPGEGLIADALQPWFDRAGDLYVRGDRNGAEDAIDDGFRALRRAELREVIQLGWAEVSEAEPDRATITAAVGPLARRFISQVEGGTDRMLARLEATEEPDPEAIAEQVFGDARVARIARTITTQAANVGVELAAEFEGIEEKTWVTERDGDVRPAHRELDGVTIPLPDLFEVDGRSTLRPGAFGEASLDIGCRCILVVGRRQGSRAIGSLFQKATPTRPPAALASAGAGMVEESNAAK